MYDAVIVGAGLFGSVVARELTDSGKKVLVVEQNDHTGGLCHSEAPEGGELIVNRYGSHIFSTDNAAIWDYVRRFSDWTQFHYTVCSLVGNKHFPFPLNLPGLNSFFDTQYSAEDMRQFVETQKRKIENPKSFEEVCLKTYGESIYQKFIYGYVKKQWGKSPCQLPPEMINRSNLRFDDEERYYLGTYTGYPTLGYSKFFDNLLSGIDLELSTDFLKDKEYWNSKGKRTVYSGPLDAYFDFSLGETGWRKIHFQMEKKEVPLIQPTLNVHHPSSEVPYNKTGESKHLKAWNLKPATHSYLIKESYEDFQKGEQFLLKPFRTRENLKTHKAYLKMAGDEKRLFWGGRTADYIYYDMDHVVLLAQKKARELVRSLNS